VSTPLREAGQSKPAPLRAGPWQRMWSRGRVDARMVTGRGRDGRLFLFASGKERSIFIRWKPAFCSTILLYTEYIFLVVCQKNPSRAGSLPNSQCYVFTRIHPPSPVFVLGDWPLAASPRRVPVGARRLVCFCSEGTEAGSTGKGGGVASQCGSVWVGAVSVLRAWGRVPDAGSKGCGDRLMTIRRMRVGGGNSMAVAT
jgi:hypothetical protein